MDLYLAEIVLWGADWAPRNTLFCNGQLLQIASNAPLFTVLGNKYGGDGRTTFGLPNLQPLQGVNYIICVQGRSAAKD